MMIRRLDTKAENFASELDALLAWEAVSDGRLQAAVDAIVQEVRQNGDAAFEIAE